MKLNIGNIIRDHRRAMDLTQEQLAEFLGVTCQSVSRWENGMTYPDIETLPLLADRFGISLDELMGHTKSAREQRLSRLWEEGEAIIDPEARFDHLARMREEYPNEWRIARAMIELIAEHGVREELLHPLTHEILENCADESIRWDVTKHYLYTVKEEDIGLDFLNRYTQHIERNSLLEQRYFMREDWERYEEIRQCNLLDQLHRIFDERLRRSYHASVVDSVWAQQTALGMINLLTGYRGATEGDLSEIVDTTPDLWFTEKYWLGLRLSCALASSGQEDAALNVLDNTVKLMENVFSLPVDTVLSYRTRTLDRMNCKIVSYYRGETWCCVEMAPVKSDEQIHRSLRSMMGWKLEGEEQNERWGFDTHPLTERAGWEWFDPIREHPRYLACIERMRAIETE